MEMICIGGSEAVMVMIESAKGNVA